MQNLCCFYIEKSVRNKRLGAGTYSKSNTQMHYHYQSKIHNLGFILITLLETMSQLDSLEQCQPPSPPRFKPMSLPFLHEISLQLDQSPEDDTIGKNWDASCEKSIRSLTKSSILKFLSEKPRLIQRSAKAIRE